MNIKKTPSALFIFAISFIILSCGSDDDSSPAKSRDIKYEVTGNFVGTLSTTYITAGGGGTSESIPSLPWNKSITYASSVPSIAISVGGTGGVAGQTINVKVFAGGSLISNTPGVADGSGTVVVASPSYIF